MTIDTKWIPWILRGLAALVVLVAVLAWNSARTETASLRRSLEGERLRAEGFMAERDASLSTLNKLEDQLTKNDAFFRAEKARLEKLLGEKPKVVTVTQIVTKPVIVQGDPVPCTPGTEPGARCVLAEGNTGHVETLEITYATKDGNRVLIGKGACFRDTPTRALLFSSPVEVPLSSTTAVAPTSVKRWGFGVWGSVGREGWDLGPALAFPAWRIFGIQVETTVGAGLGANGVWQAGGVVVAR